MEAIAALLALTLMEIVLGIDNVIFITILTDRLPEDQQPLARRLGLFLAMLSRIALLCLINIIMTLERPLFTLTALGLSAEMLQRMGGEHWSVINEVSGRDIILLLGGLFLIRHSVKEIHEQFEGSNTDVALTTSHTFAGVLINITIMDIIFSLDSVITAVGMTTNLNVMITAVVVSVLVMMAFAERISGFVKQNPTFKTLALSFLILIGVMLVAEASGTHVNKGYIYFAMAFSLIVEALNLRVRNSPTSPPADATASSSADSVTDSAS